MDLPRIVKIYHKLINSLFYFWYQDPIVITAWVEVQYGRVVHRNWGDDINVYLLEQMTGKHVVIKNQSTYHNRFYQGPTYCCIGSILGWYETPRTIVWGSGMISDDTRLHTLPQRIISVRGYETQKKLLAQGVECPPKYGDPALLISKYYQAKPLIKTYKLGIIPHYVDINNPILASFLNAHGKDVLLIDLVHYRKWTDIPDQIVSCEHIISSSLHGLIVADSYSIPNTWVKFSNLLTGGDFKFKDYFSSVKRNDSSVKITSSYDLENLYLYPKTCSIASIDFESIKSSAPFKLKEFSV